MTLALLLPKNIHGITELDRSLFKISLKLITVEIPSKSSSEMIKKLSSICFNVPRLKRIIPSENDDPKKRRLLLHFKIKSKDDIPEKEMKILEKDNCKFGTYELVIDYDYWTVDDILRAILPKNLDVASSFETIGHIAHLNLRDEFLPFKNIIGSVILDKNTNIKTVVTKTGNIESKFRTFPMEILAGENNFETEVRESNCRFRMDFSKVYWNSRLGTEHERLIKKFKKEGIIVDVFAGIGPFAIPAAKQGCKVFANDLNPNSYQYLQLNCKINKVVKEVTAYNQDGRDFMRKILSSQSKIDHIVMNLPAMAIEFLDVFDELPAPKESAWVHCYCFTKENDYESDILERARKHFGKRIKKYELHFVRKVAPKKDMYCFSFEWNHDNVNEFKKIKLIK